MVRIGIIGAGLMGRQHSGSLARLEDATLVAICGMEKAQTFALAESHGVEAYDSVEALLSRDDLDAVIVATPTDTHVEVAERVLDSGRHVFVEKPLARHMDAAQRLVAHAKEAELVLQVGHVISYFSEYRAMQARVESGALGRIATATFGRRCATPDWTADGWLSNFERSGGVMLDMMVHDIDLVRWMFGEPHRVYARAAGPERFDGVDYALATLTLSDGPICHLHASWAEPEGFSQSAEICGSSGMISYDSREPFDVRAARHSSSAAVSALPAAAAWDPYAEQLRDFVAAVGSGAPPPRDGDWALGTLRVALALLESLESGRAIELSPSNTPMQEAVEA